MRRFTIVATAAVLLFGTASAERHVAPLRPYMAVAVTLPQPVADPAFDAFRAGLAKAARTRVFAELAPLVAATGFFWGRDFGHRFDPRRPGVDNLAAALQLEHDQGAGWAALERLAAEARALPLESHPGVICAPAPPSFDTIAFDRLIDLTRTAARDWVYTRAPDVAVRRAPTVEAETIDILGLQFVRVLTPDETLGPNGWTQVLAPGGGIGFVAPRTLRRLDAPRLCYGKSAVGHWQVVGFIGRGD